MLTIQTYKIYNQQIVQILILEIRNKMIDVEKKSIKTIQDYRHNIQLLKYHLKKERKKNENLKYEAAKFKYKAHQNNNNNKHNVYSLTDTVRIVAERLKRMGLGLQDLFRMADSKYEGEINKEQFMKTVGRLKTNLTDTVFNQMFYAIDTSLNGLIQQDQFVQFSIAYGGCTDAKQIRRYQNKTKSKLINLITKKYQNLQKFLQNFKDPIQIQKFSLQFQNLGLNNSQTMTMLKTLDPSHQGTVTHKFFISVMGEVKVKSQKQQNIEQATKIINDLCIIWRDKKMNPMALFEEADEDKKDGISPFQLEKAFKKVFPDKTTFQIKKWVNLINFNNDNEITKQQFINSIRGFYSLGQINKFQADYLKKHPQLAKIAEQSEESVEKVMKKFSDAIEDKGLTKKKMFYSIDFNKSNDISKEQLLRGLDFLQIPINLIGQIMAVFDRDNSDAIQIEEWLRILGEDPEMSEVGIPDGISMDSGLEQNITKQNVVPKKDIKQTIKLQNKLLEKKNSQSKQSNLQKKQNVKNKNQSPLVSQNKPKPNQKVNEIDKSANKNNSIKESKSIVKKKQSKKPVQNDKAIINKTFAEDSKASSKKHSQILKKPMAASNVSEDVKQVKKNNKQSELKIKKTQSIVEPQIEQQKNFELNVDEGEQKLAIQYKKNKNGFLKYFKEHDPKKKGIIKMKQFNNVLKKLSPNLNDDQIKQIFMKNCVNGGQINYNEWLQNISQTYAQDIQQSQIKQSKNNIQSKVQDKQTKMLEKEQNYSQNYEEEYENNQKDQSKNKGSKLEIPKQSGIKSQTERSIKSNASRSKRGQNIPQFDVLENVKQIVSGKNIQSGYKLFDYISDEQNELAVMRQKLLEKAKAIKDKKERFRDPEFPPQQKSLIKPNTKSNIKNVELIKWKHYKQIYKNAQLFVDNADPNDIRQGGLGNCYFLSSLAGLAQYNNLIQRMFQYFDIDNGYFLIWLCIDGFWKLVEVDGYLPVRADDPYPAFSRSTNEELWVSILEKAYAKCYGNYNNIVGGQPFQAIKDLTGSPGGQFNHDHKNEKAGSKDKNKFKNLYTIDQIWNKLYEADKNQYIMTAGTKLQNTQKKVDGRAEDITAQGIVLGHAYSILDCQVIGGEKVIQLRNPWGEFEWNGNWSDKDKRWTKQLRQKYKYEVDEDDGIFWIGLADFFTNFLSTSINCIRPTFYYRSGKLNAVQQFMVSLPVNQFTTGYVTVCHKDHRHDGIPINTPYDGLYSLLPFVCSKDDQILDKFEERKYYYQRQGYVELLNMDKYPKDAKALILVNLDKTANITVGFYGDKCADFSIQRDCLKYIQRLAYAEENGPRTQTQNIFKIWDVSVQGFVFICVKNTSKDNISLTVTINNPQNLKPSPPYTFQNKLIIKPNQIQSVRAKIVGNPYSYNYGISS